MNKLCRIMFSRAKRFVNCGSTPHTFVTKYSSARTFTVADIEKYCIHNMMPSWARPTLRSPSLATFIYGLESRRHIFEQHNINDLPAFLVFFSFFFFFHIFAVGLQYFHVFLFQGSRWSSVTMLIVLVSCILFYISRCFCSMYASTPEVLDFIRRQRIRVMSISQCENNNYNNKKRLQFILPRCPPKGPRVVIVD